MAKEPLIEEQPLVISPDKAGEKHVVSRRTFFKLLGGGIAVALTPAELFAAEEWLSPAAQVLADEESIAAWIHIDEAGKIAVFTGKVEVGQNIRTSLSQVVAEELAVPIGSIEMIMGDTALTPYDRGTFGSLTTPQMAPKLRKAAASLKAALLAMAAEQWGVNKSSLRVASGTIIDPTSGKSLEYGALTKGKKVMLPVNEQVELTSPLEWKIAGTSVPKVNGATYVSGKHQYVSDIVLPDMVYGKVLRAPSYGASLVSVNTQAAREIPHVNVLETDGFVGVTAPDPLTAEQALASINAQWSKTPQPNKAEIFEYLKDHARGGREGRESPPAIASALAASHSQWHQRFEIQYIAHVPLEPRAGVAQWEGDQLTAWVGTQRPFGVQEELAREFGIPTQQIRVIMPDTGSGYGGKHTGEAAIEAAKLSKAVGKPVKVLWSREEEFMWAYFRPAGVIEVTAAVDDSGRISAWQFHNYNSGNAGIETPYDVKAKHHQFHPSNSPLRQGSYRALAATANVFAIESLMNDMAVQLHEDPLAFRLKHLTDDRLKAVLQAAADTLGWQEREKNTGNGFGIACSYVKGGYIATAVEVTHLPEANQLRVDRIVAAFECGAIINPKHLESQVMGCVLQGLGGALFEEVDFEDGRILNPTLSTYRVPRFADIPPLDIVLLDRKDLPSAGAGEAPIVCIAPAIRNAIHDATGTKLYALPLIPNGLKV